MDLNNGEITTTEEKITDLALQETSCPLLPEGTVLVAMYGGYNQIGRTGILRIEASINQAISALMVDNSLCVPEYLLNWLNANVQRWRAFAASSRKDPNITRSDVEAFPILLPPLPEQRKIAAILSTWDEAITLTERLIEALRQRKQALMQLLLTGHEVLPDDWRWGFLSEFVEQNKDYVAELEDKLYPRISVKWWAKGAVVDKFDNGLDVRMKRHQLARAGQIIVSEIWAKHGSIGVIPPDGEGALITSHFYLFDFLPEKTEARGYIYRLVAGNYFMRQADEASIGTTGYASIRATDFLRFRLPIPPPHEQQFIAGILQVCDDLIAQYEAYSTRLQAQKRGLMQQLLTGAIRVQVEE